MKHIKTQKQLNEAQENLNISDVSDCSKHAKDFAQWIFLQYEGENWDIGAKFMSGRISVNKVYEIFIEDTKKNSH